MANIGDVIALAGVVYDLVKHIKGARKAPEEWDALEKEVANSQRLLKGLQQQLQSDYLQAADVQQTIQPLFETDGSFHLLEAAFRKIEVRLKVPEKKMKEVVKALKWPFSAADIRDLLSQMQRAKGDILLILGQAGVHLDQETLDDTRAIRQYTSQAELDRLLRSISPHDFVATQQAPRKKALPGTIRWFLDGPSFQGWAENRAPVVLWCHGVPGAGKTVLAASAFEELKAKHEADKVAVLIAFCSFNLANIQNAASILSAYLKQAVELRSGVSEKMQNTYGTREGRSTLDVDKICALLTTELTYFKKVFFLLDGLDEIANGPERTLLLEKLQAMTPCPKLLATSRQLPDIRAWFYEKATKGMFRIENEDLAIELPGHLHDGCIGIANRDRTPSLQEANGIPSYNSWRLGNSYRCGECSKLICVYCYDARDSCLGCRRPRSSFKWTHPSAIDVASHDEDIERAVDEYISRSDDLKRNIERAKSENLDLRRKIMEKVKANSQNTFLLLKHQMSFLAEHTSPREILIALEHTLPTEMDEVHRELFKRLQTHRRGDLGTKIRKLIAIVASARRPLRMAALEHAMSVAANDTDIDRLRVPDARHLISKAFGLVVIDEKTSQVRLAHETAAHYIRHQAEGMPNGERLLADACIAYLQFAPVCRPNADHEILERKKRDYPFLLYASSFWASHARVLHDGYCTAVLSLLQNDAAVANMAQLMWQEGTEWDATADVHGLHLAGYFGHLDAISGLLKAGVNVDIMDCLGTTPLMYAAMKGEPEAVDILLEAGADPSRVCNQGRTALHRACQHNRLKVVQFLLRSSRDIRLGAVDETLDRSTALTWAVHNNSEAVARLLLGGDPFDTRKLAPDHDRNNPLVVAAAAGRIGLVRLLLEDGRISVNSTDERGDVPLTLAAQNGHLQIMELLLQKGADLEARNDARGTVLLSSMPSAPDHVVKFLVQRGADCKALNDCGRGVLSKCACNSRPELLRFFLETTSGLDVDIQGFHGATPLYSAVEANSLKCVEILLEFGARTDIRAKSGLTAVRLAAEKPRLKPLLQAARRREVEQRQKEQTSQTPTLGAPSVGIARTGTDQALENGLSIHAAIIQLDHQQFAAYLDEHVKKGFDINALDTGCRQTALHIAARGDLLLKARSLLDKRARMDLTDQFGFHPLHVAVIHQHLDLVQELVHRGAEVNNASQHSSPAPLDLALDRKFPKIACFLINNGAVIHKYANNAAWLIGAAAEAGEFDIVRKAVEADVPFNERDKEGETPYSKAKKHGRERIAKYLFEQAQKRGTANGSSRASSAASAPSPRLERVAIEPRAKAEDPVEEEGDAVAGAEDPGKELDSLGSPALPILKLTVQDWIILSALFMLAMLLLTYQ